jgi:hypothetical protein
MKTKKKTKKARAKNGLTALSVLKARVPTVEDRLRRIGNTLKVVGLTVRCDENDIEGVQIEQFDAEMLLSLLREADAEIWWLQKQPPSVLNAPAPDDDERLVIARAGGAR